MATKISSVNYKDIPSKTKKMRTEGQNLNKEISNAYTSIGNMSKNWYGKRYNTLVESFNKMIPSLNEMLKLVLSDIPDTLDTVASNYAKADGDTISKSSTISPKKISNVSKSNATGMRFIESDVKTTKLNVEKNFKNAITSMDTIQKIYNSIDWKSDAASAFDNKFKTLKNNITTSFEDIKKQFNELMTQTINDMSSTEKANTVS